MIYIYIYVLSIYPLSLGINMLSLGIIFSLIYHMCMCHGQKIGLMWYGHPFCNGNPNRMRTISQYEQFNQILAVAHIYIYIEV